MRQRDKQAPQSAEETVRDIRRATRRHFSAEGKIRIVLDGLRGEDRARGDRNMHAAGVGDATKAGEAVCDDGGARCDDALRQALHPAALEAGDAAQLDPSRPTLLIGLNGHDDRLLAGTAAPCLTAGALTTEVGIVHFHATVEPLAHRDDPHLKLTGNGSPPPQEGPFRN